MKKLIIIPLIMSVSSCCLFSPPPKPETVYVPKTTYVVREAPSELYDLPAKVPPLDLSKATQKDVALWLTKEYERIVKLEEKLKALKKFEDSAKANPVPKQK